MKSGVETKDAASFADRMVAAPSNRGYTAIVFPPWPHPKNGVQSYSMVNRLIKPLKSNSFFLFGARGTGKTTWLTEHFPADNKTLWFDLLNPEVVDQLQIDPNHLTRSIESKKPKWVVIDEVQKAPRLLDIVHQQIEKKHTRFILTGSSARRLKQAGTNLLAGRAFVYHLYPLTALELGTSFDLEQVLNFGSLPGVFYLPTIEAKIEYLRAYTLTYLQNEIQSEQWVRRIEPFRKFLPVAAQMNGKILNYSKIAREAEVEVTTVQNYYTILEDTLLGFELPSYHESIRKRQRIAPKFYFFDLGVKKAFERTLSTVNTERTYAFGDAFEHFIIAEIVRLSDYARKDYQFFYLCTKDDAEIDLIIDRPGMPKALIEIKSTTRISDEDFQSLKKFKADMPKSEAFLISRDPVPQKKNGIEAIPWTAMKERFDL